MRNKNRNLFYIFIFSFIIIISNFSFKSEEFDYNNNHNKLKSSDYDDIFGDIYVLRPLGSEFLNNGQNYSIKWDYKGSIELVTIALYKEYTFIDTIAITTINDGEYFWFIDNYEESNDYSIGIWDYNDFNNNDFSDFFTISSHSLNNIENELLFVITGILIGIAILSVSVIIVKKKRKMNN